MTILTKERIEQKYFNKFIVFDIKDFYPSIQEELLYKGLRFAQEYIDITSKDTEIIYHARKSLLFDEKDTWMKKQSGLFDVTMGAYEPETEKIKKNIEKLFKENKLDIVIQCNMKIVNYLHVSLFEL